MGDTQREEGQASTRVAELKVKIQQATELIGELRETNYSLSGEVTELRRELASLSEGRSADVSQDAPDVLADGGGASSHAELDALRKERKTIRSKIALLLERIEKLEP